MEQFILYIKELDQHYLEIEKFRQLIAARFNVEVGQNIRFIQKEKELFIQVESDGRKQFILMMIDFSCNRITFKKSKQCSVQINQTAFKILSSLSMKFEPQKMSFLMIPPFHEIDRVK